jgi:hypothetical protein
MYDYMVDCPVTLKQVVRISSTHIGIDCTNSYELVRCGVRVLVEALSLLVACLEHCCTACHCQQYSVLDCLRAVAVSCFSS